MGQRLSRNGHRRVLPVSDEDVGTSARVNVRVSNTEPVQITDRRPRPEFDSFSVLEHNLSSAEGEIRLIIVSSLSDGSQLDSRGQSEVESEDSRPVSPLERASRRAEETLTEYFQTLSVAEATRPSETAHEEQEEEASEREIENEDDEEESV